MYSWEIDNLLRLRNYLIENKEYLEIVWNSPQISYLKYDPFTKDYEMWTSDNFYWKYKVKEYNRKE